MKRILFFLIAILIMLPAISIAAGEYDGVWTSPSFPGLYFMSRNTNEILVFVQIDDDFEGCDVLIGPMNNGTASLSMARVEDDGHFLTANIRFISTETATFEFTSCTGETCPQTPLNQSVTFNKVL